jgi:hypothetical protein
MKIRGLCVGAQGSIGRALAKDTGNAEAKRYLSVSLDNIGDVKLHSDAA